MRSMWLRFGALFTLSACLAFAVGGPIDAADPPPLKVGFIGTFSGPYADANASLDASIAAFIKVHGAAVAGRKLEIVKRDDGGLAPDTARRLAQELIINEKVDFLLGPTLSPNAIAVGKISTEAKMPTLLANAGGYGVLEPNPYFTRFSFTTGQVTYPLADWATKQNLKSAYIIITQFGPAIDASDTFRAAFTAKGGTIVGESRVPVGSSDFSAYIQRIREAKPQAVFMFLTVSGVSFLKAWQTSGGPQSGIKLLATGDLTLERELPAEGDSALGVYTSLNYSVTRKSPANDQLIREMKAANPATQPDFYSVALYDTLAAIYNVTAAQKGVLDPEKSMALLKGLKLESARGPIEIDPQTRDCIQNIYIRRVDKVAGGYQNTVIAEYPHVRDPVEK